MIGVVDSRRRIGRVRLKMAMNDFVVRPVTVMREMGVLWRK
jgi:hypothetical protein